MKTVLVSIVVSLIISASTIYVYDRDFAFKVAVVDMDGYVSRLKADYEEGKLSSEALDERLKNLSRRITQQYSANTILLLKEVVVSGNVANFDPAPKSE